MPEFSSSFSTAAANPPSGSFQVTGVVPASGATADPGTPIVLTFNRAVNPVSVYNSNNSYFLRKNSNPSYSVPGAFQVDGATVTFTPAVPLPGTTFIVGPSGFTDLRGTAMTQYFSVFSTTSSADITPLTVTSVSPGDGQLVLYQSPYAVFTFSAPLDPATVTGTNFAAYGAKGIIAVKPTLLSNGTQVAITFNADPGSLVTLFVNAGAADISGNAAVPFRTTVRMSDAPVSSAAVVVLQRPGFSASTNLPPNTGISLIFSAPLDRASVEQGLLVSVNGVLVSGRVEWTPDSTGLTFLASTPYPYSANVSLAIVAPARDAAGNAVSYSTAAYGFALQIMAAPPAPASALAVIGSSLPPAFGPSPLDSVIDLAFNQDIPPSVVQAAVGTLTDNTTGPTRGQVISCAVTLVSPRILRFQPQSMLRPSDNYTFDFNSGGGLKWSGFIWTGTAATSNPYLAAFGPVGQSVPLNAQVTIAFSNRVAEFVMPGGLVLKSGGTEVPTRFTWNAVDRALTLTPLALLHGDVDYIVTMAGFEDLAGHAIADKTWTFHTSNALDLQPPSILRTNPSGDGVSANALVAVTFSEQVAADWIDRFALNDSGALPSSLSGSAVPGSLRFSDDQRTVFFTPDRPLAAGHTYSILMPLAGDFSGNLPPGAWYSTTAFTFRVGFAKTDAPLVTVATPDDGSSNVPLNAQFQAQFDQPVLTSSLDGMAFFENDIPLPASVRVEADGRTVTAIPQRLPVAGSTCRFVVSGVRNTDGVAMAGQYQGTFTMGATLDNSAPTQRPSPASGQTEVPLDVKVRLRFNKPLNKLTVNARNVVLSRTALNVVADAAVSLEDAGRTIVIAPTVPLSKDTGYSVGLTGVTDLAGNPWNANGYPNYYGFSTASGVATRPAALLAVDPPDGSQNVPSNARVQVLFSQPVDATLGDNSVQLFMGDVAVPGTAGGSGSLIVFTPARTLADGQYRLQVSGIADVAGNPLDSVSSTFTVAGAAGTTSPRLLSSTPAASAVGIPVTSSIVLNFSKPVSAVSAAQLHVTWQGGQIPGSILTRGSTVTFTPTVPLPGAAAILVTGPVLDLAGLQAAVNVQFTTGSNPDTTPPTLVFTYPQDGARVPASGTNIVLRFSKPVTWSYNTVPVQILAGIVPISGYNLMTLGEDSQTITGSISFQPDTDVTVAVTADLRDFAGNPMQPVSFRFRTESLADSLGPTITTVSPADGAVNVDVNSPIELHFSQPMEPVSVSSGLQVTDAGRTVTGQIVHDPTAQILTFRPDVPYQPASTVELFAGQSIYGVSGERIIAFYSHFTTLGPSANGQAVSFSVSANAIDLRFAGPLPATIHQAYLRQGTNLVPSQVVVTASDQIRVVPERTLAEGVSYHLVLDSTQEVLIQVEREISDLAGEAVVDQVPGRVRIKFAQAVNPLTILRGGVRLLGADGAAVSFTIHTGLDRREMILIPAKSAGPLTVLMDGVESVSGRHLPRTVRRP